VTVVIGGDLCADVVMRPDKKGGLRAVRPCRETHFFKAVPSSKPLFPPPGAISLFPISRGLSAPEMRSQGIYLKQLTAIFRAERKGKFGKRREMLGSDWPFAPVASKKVEKIRQKSS
jgi:hypothetical protein